MEVSQRQKDRAAPGFIKAFQLSVAKDGRVLPQGLKDKVTPIHLLAVLKKEDLQLPGLWGPKVEDQADLGQKTVNLGGQSREDGGLRRILRETVTLPERRGLSETQTALHLFKVHRVIIKDYRPLGLESLRGLRGRGSPGLRSQQQETQV
jgi:hypothetical protein